MFYKKNYLRNFKARFFFNFVLKVLNSISPAKAFQEMLIIVRGSKMSGKSSLVRRMTAKPFQAEYEATTLTQTQQFQWVSMKKPEERITITLLDVVSPNALLTSTAHGVPNGIIVMYDPRDQQSLQYAIDVVEHTPKHIPLCVLTNFQDIIQTDMHPKLDYLCNRFYHISGSMKTNLGLTEVAKWLEYPRTQMRVSIYNQLLEQSSHEISRILELFSPEGRKQAKKVSNLNGDMMLDEPDAENFWSTDDEVEEPPVVEKVPPLKRKHKKKHGKEEEIRRNPAVIRRRRSSHTVVVPKSTKAEVNDDNEDEDLMNGIIEAAQTAQGIRGKDELDFDNSFEPHRDEYSTPMPMQKQVTEERVKVKGRKKHKRHTKKMSFPDIKSSLTSPIQAPTMERIAAIQEYDEFGSVSNVNPSVVQREQTRPQMAMQSSMQPQFQQQVQQQAPQPHVPSGYDTL